MVRLKTKSTYAFTTGASGTALEKIHSDVTWLLEDAHFMYGGIDLQASFFFLFSLYF